MRLIIGVVLGCLILTTTQAASFNCAKASTKIEKMICNSSEVSTRDSKLHEEYVKALDQACDPGALKVEEMHWLKFRNTCPDEKCLSSIYEEQINRFISKNDSPIIKYLTVNPKLDKYKFEIKQQGCHEFRPYHVQEYLLATFDSSGKKIQEIVLNSSSGKDELLYFIDMDSDGYKDLSVNLGRGMGPFPFTTLYRFNNKTNLFEEDKSFPEVEGSATPSEHAGCVYMEERVSTGDPGFDYQITEWCLSKGANEWTAGQSCSLLEDKKCYQRIDAYRSNWYKSHSTD